LLFTFIEKVCRSRNEFGAEKESTLMGKYRKSEEKKISGLEKESLWEEMSEKERKRWRMWENVKVR